MGGTNYEHELSSRELSLQRLDAAKLPTSRKSESPISEGPRLQSNCPSRAYLCGFRQCVHRRTALGTVGETQVSAT
jgi:hypothetical protein